MHLLSITSTVVEFASLKSGAWFKYNNNETIIIILHHFCAVKIIASAGTIPRLFSILNFYALYTHLSVYLINYFYPVVWHVFMKKNKRCEADL